MNLHPRLLDQLTLLLVRFFLFSFIHSFFEFFLLLLFFHALYRSLRLLVFPLVERKIENKKIAEMQSQLNLFLLGLA